MHGNEYLKRDRTREANREPNGLSGTSKQRRAHHKLRGATAMETYLLKTVSSLAGSLL
jgi:hypothetical protein